ncbi:MAG: YceD family protein [Aquirhabdus sp.]
MTEDVLPSSIRTDGAANTVSTSSSAMSPHVFPTQIEPFKWAELGFVWQGQVELARFARVAAEVVPPHDQQTIALDCKLYVDDRRIAWLDATMSANLPLTCQRCLHQLDFVLDAHVHLAMFTDEKYLDRLGREKDEIDYVILSEAQIAHGAETIDVLNLLEDEILLLLPLSPKHDDCELAVASVGDDLLCSNGQVVEEKRNPFDVLAGLKLNKD